MLLFALDLNIGRIEGIILLGVFTYFLVDTVKSAKNQSLNKIDEAAISSDEATVQDTSILKTILLSIIGVVGIIIGGGCLSYIKHPACGELFMFSTTFII